MSLPSLPPRSTQLAPHTWSLTVCVDFELLRGEPVDPYTAIFPLMINGFHDASLGLQRPGKLYATMDLALPPENREAVLSDMEKRMLKAMSQVGTVISMRLIAQTQLSDGQDLAQANTHTATPADTDRVALAA